MNSDRFRRLALELPETVESAHHGHPDFRLRGKVIATLSADGEQGMVKVPSEIQSMLLASHPATLEPSSGAWGRQGCTQVDLASARVPVVREALRAAWRKVAPKRLREEHGDLE